MKVLVTCRASGALGSPGKIMVIAVDFHHWINPMLMVAGRTNAYPEIPTCGTIQRSGRRSSRMATVWEGRHKIFGDALYGMAVASSPGARGNVLLKWKACRFSPASFPIGLDASATLASFAILQIPTDGLALVPIAG
jgi:hypothetical protein